MEAFEERFFHQLAFACSEAKQTFTQQLGMSQARWQLLILLDSHGEMSHAALQQQLSLDGATITRLVKQFEAEGSVSRRLDPQNNRYTLISLTPSGHEITADIRASHRTFAAQLLGGIPREEQEAVLRVLEQLRSNMRLHKPEGDEQPSVLP
ncbi:MarR family transcriptional regulator [Ktedonosporobacter rubrisoli]|uniref:MarR family transcriptional regulator n=1 Tax=Ktedonosporobacter rubrisoli TaxID=2509675 RepID=A0A4P6JYB8_KTERU|nr:MarR family winged helix-turn-helix transcriptional regulator [Ktedonosporobacter rubrisoli]QBD80515.1 MarR family transcriptional regulator [Ktedonosporobacter rubrisoli]